MLAKALTGQGKAKPQALSARNEATMLTDAAIKKALKTGRNATLTDGTGRGSGRLALQVRAMPKRTLAEWYAVQWLAGKRRSVKLGSYPSMSLGEARTKFQEHSEAIEDRKDIRYARKAAGTVAELVEGYTAWLKANNRPSAHKIQYALKYIKPIEHLQANQVAPSDIVEILKPIHARGAPSMADHVRSYISSAFGWGIRSENDYRLDTPKRFLIKSNPVLAIPSGEKRRGERWLTKEELRQVWAYLSNPTRNPTNFQTVDSNLDCIKVILLTGQRVQEIAGIREEMVVGDCLELPTTKNGLAHVVPLPKRAREIIAAQKPKNGWVFPAYHKGGAVGHGTLLAIMRRFCERSGMASFSNRDLRRTWKTLAGAAGLSKEIRDRIQNHARSDVSSAHYDRYDYLPEKRAAMLLWEKWFEAEIAKGA